MYAVEQELCDILGAGVPELAPPHNKTFLSEVRPQLVLRLSVAGNGRTTLQRASTAAALHLAVLLCRLDVQETFGSYMVLRLMWKVLPKFVSCDLQCLQ